LRWEDQKVHSLSRGSTQWIAASLDLMIRYIEFGITDEAGNIAREIIELVPPDQIYWGEGGSLEHLGKKLLQS